MSDVAVEKAAKVGGKRKTLAEKMAEESAKIIGDLKASAGRQTRNAAKGVVYQPPVKKAKAAGGGKKGRPAKAKAAEPEEKVAEEKVADAVDAAEAAADEWPIGESRRPPFRNLHIYIFSS